MHHSITKLPERVFLGYAGEANARELQVDVAPWLAEYPGAAIGISYTRPGDPAVYPATGVELEGSLLRWRIGAGAVARPGSGTVVIRCMQGEAERHSAMVYTTVSASHGPAGAPPDPIQDWIAEAGAAERERAEAEAARARDWEAVEAILAGWDGMDTLIGPPGPAGADGPPGPPGNDGPPGPDGLTVSVCGVSHVEGDVPLTGGDLPVSGADPTAVTVILGSKLDTYHALTNEELEEMLR